MMDVVTVTAFKMASAFDQKADANRVLAAREFDAGRLNNAAHLHNIADGYAERARQLRDSAWASAK